MDKRKNPPSRRTSKIVYSIIIPVLEINDYIRQENLPACNKLRSNNFEVIILPNKVTVDDKKLKKKYSWLRIIPTGKISRPAPKRNIGAKKAKGEILAFIDDDAYPTPNWLTNADRLFEKNNVEALFGPGILPLSTNLWEKVFDEVLKTWIGSGGLSYRFTPHRERYVDDVASMNFFIKKNVFAKLCGFDGDFWPGEDSKLCENLVHKYKGKILYSPKIIIYHHRRDKLIPYLKQHGQYGFHRGAFFAHGDRNSRRLFYLAPTALVIYLLFLLIIRNTLHVTGYTIDIYFPLIAYLILASTVAISAIKNTRNLKIAFLSTIVLFLMHVTYGIKFIQGLVTGFIYRDKIYK